MGVFLRSTVVALCLFAACADRAVAQQVVAGAPPGPTLTAKDSTVDGRELLTLELDAPRDLESGDAPLWSDQGIVVSAANDAGQVVVGGAVSADTMTVELTFEGGRVERVPTVPGGAYTGRNAGQVRFFLSTVALAPGADDDPASIRGFDTAGTLIGVISADLPDERRTQIMRGRAGGVPVRMVATLADTLDPLPLAPDHTHPTLCLEVALGDLVDTPQLACQDDDYELVLGGRRGCGRVPSTLAGFVPAAATSVSVRLGSGRTRSYPARRAPFGLPGRIVTAVLPPGEAIREVTARDGAGSAMARAKAAVAPPDTSGCRAQDHRYAEWYASGGFVPGPPSALPGTEVAAALPDGSHPLLIRDSGDDICVRVDSGELDCIGPPVGAYGVETFGADPARGVIAAVYPARVAAIDVLYQDGGSERIPTVEGGYTGRYRGALRFVLAPIPNGRVVIGARALDAGGRALGTAEVEDEPVDGPTRTLLRAGRARLRAGSFTTRLDPALVPCFEVEIGRARRDCSRAVAPADRSSVEVRVPCGLRRTYVFGLARHDVRRVELVLAGGRRLRAPMTRLPHSRHRVYLAVLGARDAVREVRFAGGQVTGAKPAIALPGRPAAEQCGYESRADLS
jgi:hypothetical protein